MTVLIATSVVRGSDQGESHGGVYLVNLETDDILQPVDWDTVDIDWQGRGWDRGLRGIACHDDHIYIAASDELFVFDQSFEIVASYRNPYLKHCHEVSIHGHHLFIVSTGFDSVLGFNLQSKTFDWALHVKSDGLVFRASRYDPNGEKGPLLLNKLHLNNVHCDDGGMYISGIRTGALLRYNGKAIGVMTTLPEGIHNARPYRDGVLLNDTQSDAVRFESPTGRMAFRTPRFAPHKLTHTKLDDSRIARQGFGRGLCVIGDNEVAGGSSPSTISIYDLTTQKANKAVNLSLDVRNAIHGLAIWPFDWPTR
ncbi:MAG: hypothetical protein AAF225_08385 [Pseudomonadota bacterium]